MENTDRPYEEQKPKQLRRNLPLPLHEALEAEYVAVLGKLELPDVYSGLKHVATLAEAKHRRARTKAETDPNACEIALQEKLGSSGIAARFFIGRFRGKTR